MGRVQNDNIENGQILCISSISEICREVHEESEVEVKGCLIKNVKAQLVQQFGPKIDFLIATEGREFIYSPESVHIFNMQKTLKEKLLYDIKKIGNKIREEILNMEKEYTSWPPEACELSYNRAIPDAWTFMVFSPDER